MRPSEIPNRSIAPIQPPDSPKNNQSPSAVVNFSPDILLEARFNQQTRKSGPLQIDPIMCKKAGKQKQWVAIRSYVLFAPFQSVTCSCNTALEQVIKSVISEIGNALLPIFSIQSHQCPSERENSTLYNSYERPFPYFYFPLLCAGDTSSSVPLHSNFPAEVQ